MDDGVRVEDEARHACRCRSSSGRNAASSATRTRGVVVMRPRQSGRSAGRSRATSAPFLTMTIGSPRLARSTSSNRRRRSRVIVTVTVRDHHWECTRTSTLERPAHPSVASHPDRSSPGRSPQPILQEPVHHRHAPTTVGRRSGLVRADAGAVVHGRRRTCRGGLSFGGRTRTPDTPAIWKRRFLDRLRSVERVYVNGDRTRRVPGIVNLSFPGVESESLIAALPDIAVSTGSACPSARVEHVARAAGWAWTTIRRTVPCGSASAGSLREVDHAERIHGAVADLRVLSSNWHTFGMSNGGAPGSPEGGIHGA